MRRVGVVGAIAIGGVLVVNASPAAAAGPAAFQVDDCNQDGDQYMLADGEQDASRWTVQALNASGGVVYTLGAEEDPLDLVYGSIFGLTYRSFTVPESVEYTHVRFTSPSGAVTKVAARAEDCAMHPVEIETADPGAGLTPVTPRRLKDTRTTTVADAEGHYPRAGSIRANGETSVKVVGVAGIPANAGSVLLNVAAVDPQDFGHISVYPCDNRALVSTSNLNYRQYETRAANVFVRPGAGGKICIHTSARTHVIVDTQGYVPAGSEPVAIRPVRIADTRVGEPVDTNNRLPRRQIDGPIEIDLGGLVDDVNVSNHVVNITTTNADAWGFVTINNCNSNTSSVNFAPGRDTANLAYTPSGDTVCLYTSAPVDVVIDLVGYTTNGYATPTLLDNSMRLMETRDYVDGHAATIDGRHANIGRLRAGSVYKLDVAGRGVNRDVTGLIPNNITAAVLNVTAVDPESFGHITAYNCGSRPGTSTLNYEPYNDTANLSLVPVGADGKVCIYTSTTVDLVVDINGYVSGPRTPLSARPVGITQNGGSSRLQIVGGKAPYTITGQVPGNIALALDTDGTLRYTGAASDYVKYDGALTVTDSAGTTTRFGLHISWFPESALILSPLE